LTMRASHLERGILAQPTNHSHHPMYAAHCAQARRNLQQELHANHLPSLLGRESDKAKERDGRHERAERNDGKQPRRPVLMRRVVPASIGVVRTTAPSVMPRATAKIVRNIMAEIDPMIATQAHQRQHELADQNRAADHRADQKEPRHGPTLPGAGKEKKTLASSSPLPGNYCPQSIVGYARRKVKSSGKLRPGVRE